MARVQVKKVMKLFFGIKEIVIFQQPTYPRNKANRAYKRKYYYYFRHSSNSFVGIDRRDLKSTRKL